VDQPKRKRRYFEEAHPHYQSYLDYLRSFLFRNGVYNGFRPMRYEQWVIECDEEDGITAREFYGQQRAMSQMGRYV